MPTTQTTDRSHIRSHVTTRLFAVLAKFSPTLFLPTHFQPLTRYTYHHSSFFSHRTPTHTPPHSSSRNDRHGSATPIPSPIPALLLLYLFLSLSLLLARVTPDDDDDDVIVPDARGAALDSHVTRAVYKYTRAAAVPTEIMTHVRAILARIHICAQYARACLRVRSRSLFIGFFLYFFFVMCIWLGKRM